MAACGWILLKIIISPTFAKIVIRFERERIIEEVRW